MLNKDTTKHENMGNNRTFYRYIDRGYVYIYTPALTLMIIEVAFARIQSALSGIGYKIKMKL